MNVPVNRLAKVCGVHHSTLQRKIRESDIKFEVKNMEIEGIRIGQPLMMIDKKDAMRLCRVYKKWDAQKASDEVQHILEQIHAEFGVALN